MRYLWVILFFFAIKSFGNDAASVSPSISKSLQDLESLCNQALQKKFPWFPQARACQEHARSYLKEASSIQSNKKDDETTQNYQERITQKINLYKRAFIAAHSSNLESTLNKKKRKTEFEKLDKKLQDELRSNLVCINCTYKNRCKDLEPFDQVKKTFDTLIQKTHDQENQN